MPTYRILQLSQTLLNLDCVAAVHRIELDPIQVKVFLTSGDAMFFSGGDARLVWDSISAANKPEPDDVSPGPGQIGKRVKPSRPKA